MKHHHEHEVSENNSTQARQDRAGQGSVGVVNLDGPDVLKLIEGQQDTE
jgi:hypothetical protein